MSGARATEAGSARADPASECAGAALAGHHGPMNAGRGERLLGRVIAGAVEARALPGAEGLGPGAPTDVLDGAVQSPLRHVVQLPARTGRSVPWPAWVPAPVRAALEEQGVGRPWSHQARAAELAHGGHDVVVATGTASGKSLAYQLPVLATFAAEPRATALYLSPTKALAADQLRAVAA